MKEGDLCWNEQVLGSWAKVSLGDPLILRMKEDDLDWNEQVTGFWP
jgi:hypothetical protein